MLSRSSHRLCGSRKQLMVQVGIAWVTTLIRISLPPIERILPFQTASFCPICYLRIKKTYFFYLPMKDGSPRYLVCLDSFIGPNMEKIASFVFWWEFGLKNTEDLSMLIFWPKASLYFWRICLSSWDSSSFTLQKIMLSSAKRKWVILEQLLQMEMPVRRWFPAPSWIIAKKPSTQRRKRLGERGSPWWRPLDEMMFPYVGPFTRTE